MRNLYYPPELAKAWILHEFPRYDIPFRYVLFKPLRRTALDENIRAVIFPVNPVELSGLVTLAGSVMQGAGTPGYRLLQYICICLFRGRISDT
jgi:hypothetical protein